MNSIALMGRLGANPELKTLESGSSLTSFNLAVKNRDKTMWVRVTAWNKTAELIANYVKKGDMIGVNGRLDVREYEVDGSKRTAYEVIADQIHFGGGKKDTDTTSNTATETASDFDLPF